MAVRVRFSPLVRIRAKSSSFHEKISTKTVIVSGTADAVDKAGRKSETAYQLAKKSKELKRDMEKILTGNQSGSAGDSGDPGPGAPRKLASLNAWYTTSANRETVGGGANGGYPDGGPHALLATDSSNLRAFVESQFKAVIRTAWDDGGEPTFIMVGSFNKQVMSTFTGNATRTDRSEDKRLTSAIDVYVSDFGTHKVHPNRFQRPRDVHVLDPSLWEVRYLRSFRQWPLARTGDSEKRQIICEYTLCSKNEAGSAVIADLTSS